MERHLLSEKKELDEVKEREDQLIRKAFDKRREEIQRIRDDAEDYEDELEPTVKRKKVDLPPSSSKPPSSKKSLIGLVKNAAVTKKCSEAGATMPPVLCSYSDSDSGDES